MLIMCYKHLYIFINVSGEVKEIGDLTEVNFYKAYDECIRLFKQE